MCCTWYGRPPAQAVKGIHRLTGPLTNLPPRMIAGFCGMIRQLTCPPLLSRNITEWLISSLEGLLTPEVPWLLWFSKPTSILMEQMCRLSPQHWTTPHQASSIHFSISDQWTHQFGNLEEQGWWWIVSNLSGVTLFLLSSSLDVHAEESYKLWIKTMFYFSWSIKRMHLCLTAWRPPVKVWPLQWFFLHWFLLMMLEFPVCRCLVG